MVRCVVSSGEDVQNARVENEKDDLRSAVMKTIYSIRTSVLKFGHACMRMCLFLSYLPRQAPPEFKIVTARPNITNQLQKC
jgi:hypothetical protein